MPTESGSGGGDESGGQPQEPAKGKGKQKQKRVGVKGRLTPEGMDVDWPEPEASDPKHLYDFVWQHPDAVSRT